LACQGVFCIRTDAKKSLRSNPPKVRRGGLGEVNRNSERIPRCLLWVASIFKIWIKKHSFIKIKRRDKKEKHFQPSILLKRGILFICQFNRQNEILDFWLPYER